MMEKIKCNNILLFCIFLFFLSEFAYSSEDGFLYQLKIHLQAYGWTEKEITPFMYAAEHMNWESMDAGYGDIIAYSLHYCKSSRQETTPKEKAELAYQLSLASKEMNAVGFKDDVITRVALNTTREFIQTLNQYRKEESIDGLGDMIRQRIREQICNEGTEAQQTKLMEKIRNRTGPSSYQKEKENHGPGGQHNGPPH